MIDFVFTYIQLNNFLVCSCQSEMWETQVQNTGKTTCVYSNKDKCGAATQLSVTK